MEMDGMLGRLVGRFVANLVSLMVAAHLLRGIGYTDTTALVMASIVLAAANLIVKPILVIISLPIQIVTLGLFTIVINGLILLMVNRLVQGFTVAGMGQAMLGSIVVSIVGGLLYSAMAKSS